MMNYNSVGGPSTAFSVRNGTQTTSRMANFMRGKAKDLSTNPNVGDLKWSIASVDTNHWLLCDGRSLLRSDYLPLYNVIGTAFGSESSTTFNLPDCRGRVMGAIGQGDGLTLRTLGQYVGAETHQLSISEMPSHNHGGTTGTTSLTVSPATVVTNVSSSSQDTTALAGLSLSLVNGVSSSSASTSISPNPHSHTVTSQGGNQVHNNMQPTLFISNVFIYAG
jgi:microcystin-dependent protein